MTSAVRAQISEVDPDQPVTNIQTVDELVDNSRAQPRFTTLLLGIFSVTALLLAVVGIYGVLAYSVAERRQELGIRLALGAERADLLRMVVGQGLKLAAAGIALGVITALFLTRLLSSILYNIGARDTDNFCSRATGVSLRRLARQLFPGAAGNKSRSSGSFEGKVNFAFRLATRFNKKPNVLKLNLDAGYSVKKFLNQ